MNENLSQIPRLRLTCPKKWEWWNDWQKQNVTSFLRIYASLLLG